MHPLRALPLALLLLVPVPPAAAGAGPVTGVAWDVAPGPDPAAVMARFVATGNPVTGLTDVAFDCASLRTHNRFVLCEVRVDGSPVRSVSFAPRVAGSFSDVVSVAAAPARVSVCAIDGFAGVAACAYPIL